MGCGALQGCSVGADPVDTGGPKAWRSHRPIGDAGRIPWRMHGCKR